MRICDHPECNEKGQYPAPKSRKNLKDYFFFCLEHVRIYNKNWNYYDGMTASQIEAERDADIIGHRPLWNPAYRKSIQQEVDNLMGNVAWEGTENSHDIYAIYDEDTQHALRLLQVPAPINLANVKIAYKAWAKKLHPDSLGTKICEESENKLKEINQAYAVLKLAIPKDSA